MKKLNLISLFTLILIYMFSISVFAETKNGITRLSGQISLTSDKISKIDSWIEKNMRDGKIPGISVVIVDGDKIVYENEFGYADIKTKHPVSSETLFEIGSDSKAFTALGILKLEKEGMINLNDPVTKYIPWFKMKYVGEHRGEKINGYVNITLEQLLHHTSGIPFKSIGDIPIDNGDGALERTIRSQAGKVLSFYPGEKFLYASINYDILGLIIQNVSGEGFEQYIKKNIIEPLGLKNTYLSRNEAPKGDIATGYKVHFLKPTEYYAPEYKGNTPAGYFITNAEDLAKWIKIQLETQSLENFDKDLINISHVPDRTVAPNGDGSSYASGWYVFQDGGGMISHGGCNPNYSSYILFRPQEKIGIGILANLNSSYTEAIANGINSIILGEKPKDNISDTYISIDNVSFTTILICLPLTLITIFLLLVLIIQIVKGERKYNGNLKRTILTAFFLMLFMLGFGYCMYRIPDVLFGEFPWNFIKVWAPYSLLIAIISLLTSVLIFCVYLILTTIFSKSNDKSLFIIGILSITSGFGNAIIIFIINEALNRNGAFQIELLLFFVMGIVVYVYGQRLVRVRLLAMTNDLVYNKRVYLINRILNASYEKVEQMESGKIHAGLNNDTETISNFANITISAVTSIVTLICCFIYLGIINLYGLLVSILVISIAAGLHFAMGRRANKLWEETRNIQNEFFNFINSLIYGYKELKMSNKRQSQFRDDIQASCEVYRDKRIKGDLGFANVFVIGELLFTLVIGAVAFVFPSIFKDIQASSLRSYIFVFLYMTGPVHGVLNSIPQIIRVKISFKRLDQFSKELESDKVIEEQLIKSDNVITEQFEIKVTNVEYNYKNNGVATFKVGPISYCFKSGEITFITGGNGSGKSTLAKLITGLYSPDEGQITLNNKKISSEELRQNYSTVFSDYYLFDKLYGISYTSQKDKITEMLNMLCIADKVSTDNGMFSTTKLSSGQRKRLALLVSYLEDRPIYLFDEWAADQDPHFRKFFYESILKNLKASGKCVIAITHDDRYFHIADNVIKMEMGNLYVQ